MHIAMIAGEYPPRWGGIGSVVYHLAGHLASFGHQVTVITRADDIKAVRLTAYMNFVAGALSGGAVNAS